MTAKDIEAALEKLSALEIPFRGPFQTPKGQTIFLVENHIFTEQELLALFREEALNLASIRKIAFSLLQK
jgi:hypothetical protein